MEEKKKEVASEVIQSLKNDVVEIRKKISAKRKLGEYTKLSEIMLMNIPSKIKMLEAEYRKEYVDDIKKIYKDVEEDLNTKYP